MYLTTAGHKLMKQCKHLWTAILLATCLLIVNTAAADSTVSQTSATGGINKQVTYALGDKRPYDGKVFYVDASGMHGLEAKTVDEMGSMIWSDAVATAEANGPGWRLPTSAELSMLYERRKLIGGFGNDDYWSSTQQDVNSAWIHGFRNGDQDRYNKHSKLKVRTVRAF
jgi:Protein of unknown function (DUF1566)